MFFRNVIDVAALDSHNLQQNEYEERMKQYNVRVQQVFANKKNKLSSRFKNCILEDIPWPEKVLQSDSINIEDKKLVFNVFNGRVPINNSFFVLDCRCYRKSYKCYK